MVAKKVALEIKKISNPKPTTAGVQSGLKLLRVFPNENDYTMVLIFDHGSPRKFDFKRHEHANTEVFELIMKPKIFSNVIISARGSDLDWVIPDIQFETDYLWQNSTDIKL